MLFEIILDFFYYAVAGFENTSLHVWDVRKSHDKMDHKVKL